MMSAEENRFVDRSYELLASMGHGAMGAVYRARRLLDGHVLALKLVRTGSGFGGTMLPVIGSVDPDFNDRLTLAREFQTLASLHHPNVIRVQSYGFDETLGPYYTMELLEKPQTFLEAAEGLNEVDKVLLLVQLLRALVYIHHRGIIHRDVKPSNVLVVHGEVKLLDFGIATEATEAAEIAGTAEYMAPEILLGAPPSPQSDLYAVGVLLYQLLTGGLPQPSGTGNRIDGDTEEESATMDVDSFRSTQGTDAPLRSSPSLTAMLGLMESRDEAGEPAEAFEIDVPGPLGDVIRGLIRSRPEDRYADSESVLRDLAAALQVAIPLETTQTRESFISASVMVGRERESELLRGDLRNARGGQGGVCLIGGESGVGKSRLVSELRTLALVQGCWVAEGQSVTEGGVYYQEWLPLLRAFAFRTDITDTEAAILKDLVPDLGQLLRRPLPTAPPVRPEETQARIATTVIGLLHRLHGPLLMLMEDLHWARPESLALLAQVAAQAKDLRLLIVATYRSDETPELPSSFKAARHLPLKRLSETAIARLSVSMLGTIGQRPDLVEYLMRQSEGNVFFLVEIVRALAENAGELRRIGEGALPEQILTDGIGHIIERRIERMPQRYQPLLEFAARLGRQLDLRVLAAAFPDVTLQPLLISGANAAVLDSQADGWRFAHDKLRETILRRIPAERSAPLHLRVAQAIEAAYVGSERNAKSALLAYHYSEAGAHSEALGYWIMAGDSATKLCLFDEARRHYAAARASLAHLAQNPAMQRPLVDVLLRQVQAGLLSDANETQLQRMAEARTVLEALAQRGDATPEDRLRGARVDYYCGRAYFYNGQPTLAIQHYRRVLPIAQEFNDQELLVMPSYVIGLAVAIQGQFGRARALLERATQPLERLLGPSLDTIRCHTYYCIALSGSGLFHKTLSELPQARKWAEQADKPMHMAAYSVMAGLGYLLAGDWSTTIRLSRKAYELAMLTNEKLYAYTALDLTAWSHSHLGMHEQALEERAAAAAIRSTVGGGVGAYWFEAGEAEIWLNAGRVKEGLAKAQAVAQASTQSAQPYSQAVAERLIGRALAALGAPPSEYEPHLQISLDICQANEQVVNGAQTELSWALLCKQRGDVAAADLRAARAMSVFAAGGYEYALKEAQRQLEVGVEVAAADTLAYDADLYHNLCRGSGAQHRNSAAEDVLASPDQTGKSPMQ